MSDAESPDARRLASYIPVAAGPWLSEADQVYDAEGIFEYIDGAGEVYRSYNMRLLVARRFHKDGKPDIVVDAFDMGSSEDAFGVFTHDLDGESAAIGQGSVYKAGLLSFWKDRYFLSVYAEEETAETKGPRPRPGTPHRRGHPRNGRGARPAEGPAGRRARSPRGPLFPPSSVLNYHYFVAEENILLLDRTTDAVLAVTIGEEGERSGSSPWPTPTARPRRGPSRRSPGPTCPMPGNGRIVRTENGKWTSVRGRRGDPRRRLRRADGAACAGPPGVRLFPRRGPRGGPGPIDSKQEGAGT